MSHFIDISSLDTELVMKLKEEIEQEGDILSRKMDMVHGVRLMIDEWVEMRISTDKAQEDISSLRQQLDDERKQRAEMEMKLNEMSKLSTGMAKKASEEAMLKALRTYANTSKRKTVDKRAFAKTAILEMANANGLDLPEDLKATIESLDDEQPDPKMVVNGDFVQSKHVDNEVNNVAQGATGVSINKG